MTIRTPLEAPTTIPEKFAWLEERYWRFGLEADLDDQLLDLFESDENGEMTDRPRVNPLNGESRGLLVVGRSGDGKTALLQRMLRVNPVLNEATDGKEGNTLYITVPFESTIKKLAELILKKTGYHRVDAKLRSADAWEMVIHRLKKLGIRAIIIDECHHIFRRGPGRDVAGAIQALKHIMQSAGGVALIIAGIPSLRDAILSEASGETARRLQEFSMGDIRPDSRQAAAFANNFAYSAKALGIDVPEGCAMAERILFAKHGQIGRSVELGKLILTDALIRKRTELSLERAEIVYRRNNKCIGLSPFHPSPWESVRKELYAIGWGQ